MDMNKITYEAIVAPEVQTIVAVKLGKFFTNMESFDDAEFFAKACDSILTDPNGPSPTEVSKYVLWGRFFSDCDVAVDAESTFESDSVELFEFLLDAPAYAGVKLEGQSLVYSNRWSLGSGEVNNIDVAVGYEVKISAKVPVDYLATLLLLGKLSIKQAC